MPVQGYVGSIESISAPDSFSRTEFARVGAAGTLVVSGPKDGAPIVTFTVTIGEYVPLVNGRVLSGTDCWPLVFFG